MLTLMKPLLTRRHALATVALSTGSLLSGCKGQSDTIKVGEFASLTGKEATFGQSSHKGTLLAIEALNAAGRVLGKQFEIGRAHV